MTKTTKFITDHDLPKWQGDKITVMPIVAYQIDADTERENSDHFVEFYGELFARISRPNSPHNARDCWSVFNFLNGCKVYFASFTECIKWIENKSRMKHLHREFI